MRIPLWAAPLFVLAACGEGPVEPSLPTLELLVAGGDGQYGAPGQRLVAPLQALVRRADNGTPQEGLVVTWSVESGGATLVTSSVGTSNAQGLVSATVQLGATPGEVKVRAVVRDQPEASVLFVAFAADRPQLSSLSSTSARGGDTLRVQGTGFSPTAIQNVVLFSGIRGNVVSASAAELRVEVPRCLPSRTVQVTTQLGTLVSGALPLTVSDGGTTTVLTPGAAVDVDDPAGLACLRLAGGRRYLVVVQSAGTVGGAKYPFVLRGLSSSVSSPTGIPVAEGAGALEPGPLALRFETGLRLAEARMARERAAAAPRAEAAPAVEATVPAVGSKRTFKVLNAQGTFSDVQAGVRLVSDQAVLYVDDAAPGGGFTATELGKFADTFDDLIHPTVTRAFGAPSDLDGNQRVTILFTPAVNRLTAPKSDGFIGGFFYGADLLDREGSNHGEIFYAMVPDSIGQFSDPRPRDAVLRVIPAILAHEFQHMVHFNERVLVRKAESTEALWLSEGLAQMAEELVARALEERGDVDMVEEYRSGNRTRARRYLADPGAASLIVASGQGSIEERGAGWLHVLYLWDRGGDQDALARLTKTTLSGTANVAAVTGVAWKETFADWAAALYVDPTTGAYPFAYPTVRLRALLRTTSPYPLVPEIVGPSDFARSGSLWSSSARHYIVVPPASGFLALRLGGEAGGNAPAEGVFRLRVVPLF